MIRWEYLQTVPQVQVEELNKLGAEGWETVLRQALPVQGGPYLLKRPYKLCSECNTKVTVTLSHCGNCGAPVA